MIEFYMLDNCMVVFFVVGVIMKEICAVMTWFMEIVKLFENLKHLCMLLYYGSCFFVTFFIGFFETISHVS